MRRAAANGRDADEERREHAEHATEGHVGREVVGDVEEPLKESARLHLPERSCRTK